LRPLRADLLSRATWQIRSRGGADVFVHLPLAAAATAIGAQNVPQLFGDMTRYTAADGVAIDMQPPSAPPIIVDEEPGDIRARRESLSISAFQGWARLGLESYRTAASIDPRQRLMLAMNEFRGPPEWADIGLLPPAGDPIQIAGVAERL